MAGRRKSEYEIFHPIRWPRAQRDWNRLYREGVRQNIGTGITMDGMQRLSGELVQAYNDAISAMPFKRRPDASSGAAMQEMNIASRVLEFWDGNRNIFVMSDDLFEQLSNTSAGDVPFEDITWPAKYFFVAFPQGNGLSLWGPPNEVDGVYVDVRHANSVIFAVLGRPLPEAPRKGTWPTVRDLYTSYVVDEIGGMSVAEVVSKGLRENIKNLDGNLSGAEVERLQSELRENFDVEVIYAASELRDGREKALLNNFAVGAESVSCAVSLCCYLSSGGDSEERWPDTHSNLVRESVEGTPRERKNARSELTRLGILPFRYVRGVPIDRSAITSGRSVSVHWRRGHFRSVPMGEGRVRREIRWIKPVLVNAKTGGKAEQVKVYRERRSLPRDLH